jgi:hypothetical protein
MLPTPHASATATASAGLDTEPIGACWIGTRQPTTSVNRVPTAMIATLHRSRQQPAMRAITAEYRERAAARATGTGGIPRWA